MVVGSRPTLQRMVQIHRQQAELLRLQLLRISTQIEEQNFQIRQLQQLIADMADGNSRTASTCTLVNRSHWIQHTQQQIAECRRIITQLNIEQTSVDAQRRQIERRAEASNNFVDEKLRLERNERKRVEQIKLDEIALRPDTE